MAKGKLEVPYPVPTEQLRAFRLRLQYGRRLGSREVFCVDRLLFGRLCREGFANDPDGDPRLSQVVASAELPAFVLLAAELLPNSLGIFGAQDGRRALLTLRVRRKLPPYQSVHRYVVGETITAVQARVDLPKRERKPKVVAKPRVRRLVSREG